MPTTTGRGWRCDTVGAVAGAAIGAGIGYLAGGAGAGTATTGIDPFYPNGGFPSDPLVARGTGGAMQAGGSGPNHLFTRNGGFLGTSKTGGSNIMISQGNGSFAPLSKAFSGGRQGVIMAKYVTLHYARQLGITRQYPTMKIGVGQLASSKGDVLMFHRGIAGSHSIRLNVIRLNVKGNRINPILDNYHNFQNSLMHEKFHADHAERGIDDRLPLNHVKVILDQIQDPTFDKTTPDFKDGAVRLLQEYLKDAYSDPSGTYQNDEIYQMIDSVNKILRKRMNQELVPEPSTTEIKFKIRYGK